MKNLTVKTATKAIREEANQEPRHNMEAMVKACRDTAKFVGARPMDIFRLLVFNEPVPSFNTHSYGFHTGTGRYMIERTISKYYQLDRGLSEDQIAIV